LFKKFQIVILIAKIDIHMIELCKEELTEIQLYIKITTSKRPNAIPLASSNKVFN